jgi:5-methylcytosine-specific restriction endonuclease McrA
MKKVEYREQALKIFPWVCASCGRDFSGKNLRELTVHHKDHNYKNNPPDGSNWELLCIYCHDNEHARDLDAEWLPTHNSDADATPTSTHTPFAALSKLLRSSDKSDENPETDKHAAGAASSTKKKQSRR